MQNSDKKKKLYISFFVANLSKKFYMFFKTDFFVIVKQKIKRLTKFI